MKTKSTYFEIHKDNECVVPQRVIEAVTDAANEVLEATYRTSLTGEEYRSLVDKAVARRMNGSREHWRFCSCYRHEHTAVHALIYAIVSTVGANREADILLTESVA